MSKRKVFLVTSNDPWEVVALGFAGENLARTVEWDIGPWVEAYGEGEVQLLAKRPVDKNPYPVVVTRDGNSVLWTVRKEDLWYGNELGQAQLFYLMDGQVVARSKAFRTMTREAIEGDVQECSEPERDWVEQVLQSVAAAEESGGRRRYEMALENARDFAVVLSEEFSVEQRTAGETTVLYYYYDDAAPQRSADLARDCLLWFSDTFGEYAYETYSVVQTGFCYGGMEYPALVYVSDALAEEDAAYTLVHETAHQWWYAAVGSDQLLHAWQDEGLAEYSALLYFEESGGYGFTREGLLRAAKGMYNAYYSVRMQVFGEADTTMDRALSDFGEYEYVALAYAKGALLFDALREGLGDKKFFAGLRRYYSACSGKLAAPEDLAASFKNAGAGKIIASYREGKAVI